MIDVGAHNKRSRKEKNPFSLPDDWSFLSYSHYLKASKKSHEIKKISRKELCGYLTEEETEAEEALKNDTTAGLMKQLSNKRSGNSFSKLRYIQDVRMLCKLRLIVGKKHDGCILMDQKLALKRKKFTAAKAKYLEYVAALERFLAYDYNESMNALDEANVQATLTMEMTDRRDKLSQLCGKARIEVNQYEEIWRTVKACHRFLHRLAPNAKSDQMENTGDFKMFKPEDKLLDDTASLNSIIEKFENDVWQLSNSNYKNPAELGLVTTDDILRIFGGIEEQNASALIHLESLDGLMNKMLAGIDVAKLSVKQEVDEVLDDIRSFKTDIEQKEKRAEFLEQCSDTLIKETFQKFLIFKPALHLRIFVEDAYDNCIAQNEAGMESLTMILALESLYEALSMKLDGLPRHLVHQCEHDSFKKTMRETREAVEASEKFDLMQRLLGAVRRLMEPTEPKRRPLMKRSIPESKKVAKNQIAASVNQNISDNFFD